MKRILAIVALLPGCGPINGYGIPCRGADVVCDCALTCEAFRPDATAQAVDMGSVFVTFDESEGCTPSCRWSKP